MMRARWLVAAGLAAGGFVGCATNPTTAPHGTMIGTVLEPDGSVAHGAVVWVRPLAIPEDQTTPLESITDAAGRFRFDGLTAGDWRVVTDHGPRAAAIETVTVPTGAAWIPLHPAAVARGRATLEGLGPGGSIAVRTGAPEAATITAADGGWTLPGLAPGAWRLAFSRDCYRDTTVTVTVAAAGDTVTVPDVTLTVSSTRDTVLCPPRP
ncbi:MAG: carboxypeptidase-like regulatory domain-containing protein [Candidatus Eisenbacteria bacterium]